MPEIDVTLPSYAQQERIATALDIIALKENQEAAATLEAMTLNGAMSSEKTLDTACQELLDGTNTTRVFWAWYPRAMALGETNKYKLLSRFLTAAAQAWKDKTYTLRSYDPSVSGVTKMTPMDNLANKEAAQLCTESTEAVEDWTDEDPTTWYIRANALSLEDGTMNITFFEGEDGFDITGEDAPVYTFAAALWIKEWNDGSYDYISFRTTKGAGYYPDVADVDPENKKRAITWHPSFPGGLNSKGALTSGTGRKAYIFASAQEGIQKARQMTPYEGLWNDCDTRWLLRMWQLRHFDLENSNIAEGCTSYNCQYMVAVPEENVKRILLPTNQGSQFLPGSTVSVGDMGEQTNKDRYNVWMRNLADLVQVASVEKVIVNDTEYTAVNLNIEETITTTATTCISTMPWHSGNTEKLPGHKDGCTVNLKSGKTPLRVAGVEVLDGAYAIGLDPLYNVTANTDGGFNYTIHECRDSQKLANSITADYKDTGISFTGMPNGWNYVKAFVKTKLGVLFPKLIGGSSTTFFKSAFCGAYSAGVRCPWRFAGLNHGGIAGLAAESGNDSPGVSHWNGRPRLCGAGKKRGEWSE